MAKTIISVDDSASIRQMVSFTLQEEGYNVLQAVDGADGLTKFDGQQIDLALIDVNMPNMNGIELTAEIRKISKYKFMPILILTTEAQKDRKMEGKKAGATGWIVKPFNPEKLLKVVKKVLR
ncbi:MAG: response regulator [Candidatus Cloacimonadota bacterium]|nr:response regulator [Candidatus Cloacimonadota bacterium]